MPLLLVSLNLLHAESAFVNVRHRYICMQAFIRICKCRCKYVLGIHTCIYRYTHIHVCMCTCVYIYAYAHREVGRSSR